MSEHLSSQDGVVSRRQLLGEGWTQIAIERALRRHELVPIHPGVYVNHTGTPSPAQRRWAAVLYAAPAALHLEHALPSAPTRGPVDVAIDWSRRMRSRRGIRIHRVRGLAAKARWNQSPPRVRPEVATLALAARARTDIDAIARLCDAVGSRRTTASRLAAALERQPRLPRHLLLTELLVDLENGTHSVLEHGFLSRVLRPHGLPEPSEQQAPRGGPGAREYRDVRFGGLDSNVELDGRSHDETGQRDADADRDLDDLADGMITPRLRYRQVFGTPCRTAERLGRFFAHRGWTGKPHGCSDGCEVGSMT